MASFIFFLQFVVRMPFGQLLSKDIALVEKDQLDLTWRQPGAILFCSLLWRVILDLKWFSLGNIEIGL